MRKGGGWVKKFVSLIAIIVILAAFSIATSGCGANTKSNRYLYFTETQDITKTENSFIIKIEKEIPIRNPDFFMFDIYKGEGMLSQIKDKRYSFEDYNLPEAQPTVFGFDMISTKRSKGKKEKQLDNLVLDEKKFLKYSGIMSMIDTNNNLGYACSDNNLTCLKLTEDGFQLIWQIEFENGRLSDIPIGDSLVLYNKKDIMIIDTKNVKITNSYRIKEAFDIAYVKPVDGSIWVFRLDTIKQKENDRYIRIHFYAAYYLNITGADFKVYKFRENFNYLKVHYNSPIFNTGKDFYLIDNNLNTSHFDIGELHSGANREYRFLDYSYIIEVDMFEFQYDDKEYILDIDNPTNLHEKPKGLISINWAYRGFGWGYCFRDQGYLVGYDINNHKTTWKIHDSFNEYIPWLSTENGILVSRLKSGYEYFIFGNK